MPKNAITLLEDDHEKVRKLFEEFEKYAEKKKPSAQGRKLADQIIHELTVHASIEERVFYPLMREALKQDAEGEDLILESLEEHHLVKTTLTELAKMDVADERFNAKMTVLTEMVTHHADEEEDELFPKVQDACDEELLERIGAALLAAKKDAPSQPVAREETPRKDAEVDRELLAAVKALGDD